MIDPTFNREVAQRDLQLAKEYAYDQFPEQELPNRLIWNYIIARAIMHDLCDRSGIKDKLLAVDIVAKRDIINHLALMIEEGCKMRDRFLEMEQEQDIRVIIDNAIANKARVLNLSNLELTELELPEKICQLEHLVDLNLENNLLTTIPDSILKLKNLKWLYLGNNLINKIPNNIDELKSLERLGLWENGLTKLPESLGNLVNLSELYLNKNQLISLPESIGNLQKLTYLVCKFNPFQSLPKSIINLQNLKVLDIAIASQFREALDPEIQEFLKRDRQDEFPIDTRYNLTNFPIPDSYFKGFKL